MDKRKGRRISPKPTEEAPPQGFEVGKWARRGWYQCSWGCLEYFDTKEKVEYHGNCVGKVKTYETMRNGYKRMDLPIPEELFLPTPPEPDIEDDMSARLRRCSVGSSNSSSSYLEIAEYFKKRKRRMSHSTYTLLWIHKNFNGNRDDTGFTSSE